MGRLTSISLDCPDPSSLADFYGDLLGMRRISKDRMEVLSEGTSFVTMMRIEDYVAPTWPEPGQLQQMHLDISITDLECTPAMLRS